jgi:anti-sigma factor RsiW
VARSPHDGGEGGALAKRAIVKPCEMALLVQADIDGELDVAQVANVITHLEHCSACREDHDILREVRAAMRSATYHRADPGLRAAVLRRVGEAAVDEPAPAARLGATWWRLPASFGVGAVLAASLTVALMQPRQAELVDLVVAGHIRSLQPGHLEDVTSTDRHTVKPWFDGRLDFAPPVKDLAADGYPLLGGRLDYIAGRPVAALVYGRAKHFINVFVWPGDAGGAAGATGRDGYNVVHWNDRGMTFWSVSDVAPPDLENFADRWRVE